MCFIAYCVQNKAIVTIWSNSKMVLWLALYGTAFHGFVLAVPIICLLSWPQSTMPAYHEGHRSRKRWASCCPTLGQGPHSSSIRLGQHPRIPQSRLGRTFPRSTWPHFFHNFHPFMHASMHACRHPCMHPSIHELSSH